MLSFFIFYLVKSRIQGPCFFIRAFGDEGIEHIGYHGNTGFNGNFFSLQAPRIPCAIEFLMMVQGNDCPHLHKR